MRAMTARTNGGPEVLREEQVPVPEPGPTEIRVAVHAAGINPTDWKARASGGFDQWDDPRILGFDVSGVVDAVGPGASLYAVGDEVYGMPRFPRQAGAYAEYVAAPSRHFAPKPASLDHVHAAGLPLVGLTAWQGLVEVAGVTEGQRVLVHAAAGGLGHIAVQVAKARGAYVLGTASAGKHDLLRDLGVDEPIDYHERPFEEQVTEPVDVVFDTIGGDYGPRSVKVIRDGGAFVTVVNREGAGPEAADEVAARGIKAGWTLVEPDRHGLLHLNELVESGALRVEIDEVVPLAEAARAHEIGERGRTTGKLVLRVRG